MKPLAVDLCCGLGGWTDGLISEGWDVVGFDIERHDYGTGGYPAQLVLQDILTLVGRQFVGKVSLIVASPPCQFFSYCAMPWSRAKQLAADVRADPVRLEKELAIFNACVRIGREAECPIVIENVRGAQPWIGRSRANFGSYHLWGDVPALMPMIIRGHARLKTHDGEQWNVNRKNFTGPLGWKETNRNPVHELAGQKRIPHRPTGHWTNPNENGTKQGGDWFNSSEPSISRMFGSKTNARKAASAAIAKIPLALSRWVALVYYPKHETTRFQVGREIPRMGTLE